MRLSAAERIVGYEISLIQTPERPLWTVVGDHPDYKFQILRVNHTPEIALKRFVQDNYRLVSQVVLSEQNYRCLGCGRSAVGLEIDHIIARSHGRDDRRENLRALCSPCHKRRHSIKTWKPACGINELNQIRD